MLANTVDRRRFEITALRRSPVHLCQPALLCVAFKNTTPVTMVRDGRRLLARHVRFIEEPVTRTDLRAHTIRTGGVTTHAYDGFVVATGVTTDPSQIPGPGAVGAELSNYHATIAQARKVGARLGAFRGGTIALGQSGTHHRMPAGAGSGGRTSRPGW